MRSATLCPVQTGDIGTPMVPAQGQEKTNTHLKQSTSISSSQAEKELSLSLPFVQFKHSIDWMMPTHTEEGNFLFSVCWDFLLSLLVTPLQMPRNNVQPDIWASCGPVKLEHKIAQHRTNLLGPAEQSCWRFFFLGGWRGCRAGSLILIKENRMPEA